MKTAIRVGGPASGGRDQFESMLKFATEAEKVGVDQAWSAEAWGMDAIAPLAYLAAKTQRLQLGTGIMQLAARTPAATAMTAMSMATVTNGRFLLGLGNSGPQVVEGLHGQRFERPVSRLRETVEIVRKACTGEKIEHEGKVFELPRRGGAGKALRIAQPPERVPIYLATLAPKALELTGAIADGWLGTCFVPDAPEAHLDYLRRGAESAGRTLNDLALNVDAAIAFTDDPEQLFGPLKMQLAFQLSAMGSPTMKFYNDAYQRGGFAEACEKVRSLWLEKKRQEAVEAVPDEMVMKTAILGDEAHVRARLGAYRDAGISEILLHPLGGSTSANVDILGKTVDILRGQDAG